jgi:hypothetical protein
VKTKSLVEKRGMVKYADQVTSGQGDINCDGEMGDCFIDLCMKMDAYPTSNVLSI